MKYFTLNDGNKIPALGLGTFPMNGKILRTVAKEAYLQGYRLFDTSAAYGNEKALGDGLFGRFLFKTGFDRKSMFLSTKLFLDACRTNTEKKQLIKSLKNLRVKYIDLWLMHWADIDYFIKNYKVMEELKKEGLAKSIGVCNFEIHHLEKLMDKCEIIPAVNQVECHPLLTQKPLIEFCNKNKILVESYSPFARMDERLIEHSILCEIAKKYNKKVTQIILKWNIQQGRIVIPKTSNLERLYENIDIENFELTNNELLSIDNINQDIRVRFHPDIYPQEN